VVLETFGEVVVEVERAQAGVQLALLGEERLAPEVAPPAGQRPGKDKGVMRWRVLVVHRRAQRVATVVPVDGLVVFALPRTSWRELEVGEHVDTAVSALARTVGVRVARSHDPKRELLEAVVGQGINKGLAVAVGVAVHRGAYVRTRSGKRAVSGVSTE